jgi:hypothetical protein
MTGSSERIFDMIMPMLLLPMGEKQSSPADLTTGI